MTRLISRLDIKSENLIKGIRFEGLRVIGDPSYFAKKYYLDGIDEIVYIDTVASLYGRNNLKDILEKTVKEIFVPMAVGGGLFSINSCFEMFNSGADKIFINTSFIENPPLIKELIRVFGSSNVICSIEAKKISEKKWEAYTHNGRERTYRDALEWFKYVQDQDVGEVFLTSIDKDGTRNGFDLDLIYEISKISSKPLIIGGGYGSLNDLKNLKSIMNPDAIAIGSALHYGNISVKDIKKSMKEFGYEVRL